MPRQSKKGLGYYDILIFLFRNAVALVPVVMVPFGLLIRQQFVDSHTYSGDVIFFAITIAYLAVSCLWFWYRSRLPGTFVVDICFIILFHALTLLFILFVSSFLSAFLAVWIALIVSTHIRFGAWGFLASFSGLVLAGVLSFVIFPITPIGTPTEILQSIFAIGLISFVIASMRSVTDGERNELVRIRKQETYQRERLLALINSMSDAVVATDERGTIRVYNSTFLNLLDTNLNLTGKQVDQVIKATDSTGRHIRLTEEANKRPRAFSRDDLVHSFADGETIKLYANVAPIRPSYQSKAESGFIFIFRDITKQKTLDEERDEFISVVSHELRTPVAIAEGNLSNIVVLQQRGASSAVVQNAAAAAHEQIIYLAKLVNDLGTLSRAERGVGAEADNINLDAVIQDVYKTFAPQAQAKGLRLDLALAPHTPAIHMSRLYLQEILQNFITNAIKYTKEGSVAITVSHNKSEIVIAVKDSGIGISKADQKHIFEKFYRSEDYRTRESTGTGLGLYVCKKLAQKLNIQLDFQSRLNHGSTFTITIPASLFVSPAGQTEQ